jgi:hypothetical protein
MTGGTVRLSSDVDICSASILETVARCEEITLELKDSAASVDALRREEEAMRVETARLRKESCDIYDQSKRISESYKTTANRQVRVEDEDKENENERNKSSLALALAISSSASPSPSPSSSSSSSSLSFNHGVAIKERLSLMQAVEEVYQRAVLTQSAAKREEDAIKSTAKRASLQCQKDKEAVAILDQKILLLKDRRAHSEEALRAYTESSSLKDIQENIMTTVDQQESTLRDLELDRNHLLLLSSTLVRTEESLRNEIAEMRNKILEYHRNKVKVMLLHRAALRSCVYFHFCCFLVVHICFFRLLLLS